MKKNNIDVSNSLRTFQLREEKELDAQEIARLRAENRKLKGLVSEFERTLAELKAVCASREAASASGK